MRGLPLSIGILHFVGIGGIGMSGIAEILHNLGYSVRGSDLAESANVKRLREKGIAVDIGHIAEHIQGAGIVVISSAVKPDNPEFMAAKAENIPVVRRADMLAELMRLKFSIAIGGTHGKTTTTSLVAALLDEAGLDPTVINGGIINAYGTNARLGAGNWLVAEADESDGTFLRLPSVVAVVTNIDPEHMEHYGTEEKLVEAFRRFVESVPFYGVAVMCSDHPRVAALVPQIEDRRVVTYGFGKEADIRGIITGSDATHTYFTVSLSEGEELELKLPMHGKHNISNALAAIAIARELGFEDVVIDRALAGFGGVKRRFTKTGEARGITVIDDYAHHPVEIAAVLEAARAATKGRVIAVMQPHRYTRLRDLFDAFCGCFRLADHVLIADVYAAGETPITGADRDSLVAGILATGHGAVAALDSAADLPRVIADLARSGDLVVCMGAGNITQWAQDLPAQLQQLELSA